MSKALPRVRGEFLPGDRVVSGGRKGVVHFMGLVKFATGKYVGIELDTAEGKHDGAMKGDRYFSCRPLHGIFVKPSMVVLDAEAPNGGMAQAGAAPPSAGTSRATSRRPSAEEQEQQQAAAEATTQAAHAPAPSPKAAPVAAPTSAASAPVAAPAPAPAAEPVPVTPAKAPSAAATSLASALETKNALRDSPLADAASPVGAPRATTFALPPLQSVKPAPATPAPTSAASAASVTSPKAVLSPHGAHASHLPLPVHHTPAAASSSSTVAASAHSDSARIQAAYDALKLTHAKQTTELATAQSTLDALQASHAKVAEESKRLAAELSARDRTVSELRTQVMSESSSNSSSAQIESLQNMVEMLTLDKALAEESNEGSLLELGNLQNSFQNLEVEFGILKEQHAALQHQLATASANVAAPAGGGALITAESAGDLGSSAANSKLIEQNQLLTDALRKLRDLNLSEKQSSTARIHELEKSNALLSAADKDNVGLRDQLAAAQASVASLKEQLDEALELQGMVESLSSQKLDLDESNKAATRTIAYLQSLIAAQEDVEEGYKELQAQLQSEVTTWEANFIDLNSRYKLKNTQIEDLQATNRKFRALVRTLEQENAAMKAQQIEGTGTAVVASSASSASSARAGGDAPSGLVATRASSLLSLRLKQVRTAHLDALLVGVDRALIEKKMQFLMLYIPSNISIDDRSLSFLQLLERIKAKASVLAKVWAEYFGSGGVGADASSASSSSSSTASLKIQVDTNANGTTPELSLLAYNACLLLVSMVHALENLTGSLYTLDLDSYNSLCIRSMGELAPLDNILDSYLSMMSLDTINEMTSLNSLVQANAVLYGFLIEKVALPPPAQAGLVLDEFNALPYQMGLWTVIKKAGTGSAGASNAGGEETVSKWSEMRNTFRAKAAAASKRPPITGPAAALLPSAVPSLSTFALTLTYSASLSQTLSQLVGDQLNALGDAMRRGRKQKALESTDASKKKALADALGGSAANLEASLESSVAAGTSNAALADYSSSEDADTSFFTALWSEISDACLNNLTLAGQLQSTMRNYHNSLGAASGNVHNNAAEKVLERERQETAVRALLPHMHAVDDLAHRSAMQLSDMLHAIQPLMQIETLNEIAAAMPLEVSSTPPSHPVLQQLQSLLQAAKAPEGDAALLASLGSLRSSLFGLSKQLMQIIDDNTAASHSGGSSGSDLEGMASRAIHQRQASFVLTAPESALQAAPAAADAAGASNSVVSSLQPWFHHPLTIRAQLSASAALRIALQDLSTKLGEKQKEVYLTQRMVQEEKAKHDVLSQQLALHVTRANSQNDYAALNENLRAQNEESLKQLNLAKLEVDKLNRDNRSVRKQMLKLKQQYLKDEQTRAQMQQSVAGMAPIAGGGAASSVGALSVTTAGVSNFSNLSSLSSANLSELLQEIALLRRTLRAAHEELAHWKAKQALHELRTQMLPPLPAIEPVAAVASRSVPTLLSHLPVLSFTSASAPAPSGSAAVSAVLPASAGWDPTPFQASKIAGQMSLARNPYLATMPPAIVSLSAAASKDAAAAAEAEESEARLLRGKLSELAQSVWRARVTPRIVRLPDPARQREESKSKEDSESNSAASSSSVLSSPFQQYVSARVQAVQMQQCCDKIGQRINLLADKHSIKAHLAV